jgi:protein-tyrosine phosphatase
MSVSHGLVDLHCHILPGIDDGAADMEDAVAMAAQAADDGIGTVCATPHIRHDHDVRIGELADRVTELGRAIGAAGLSVAVVTGGEVAETALEGLTDDELRAVSLGGGNVWVLLEPGPGPLGPSLVHAVDRLAQGGRRAVVAHPERHVGHGFEETLGALVARGALVQATAAHVLDSGSGPVLVDLVARGLVHLLGSDAHSARVGRPVAVSAALRALPARNKGFAVHAPAAVLRGEQVDLPQASTGSGST